MVAGEHKCFVMYLRLFLLLLIALKFTFVQAQHETISPKVKFQNGTCIIDRVILTDKETIVYIKYPRLKGSKNKGSWVRISSNTLLFNDDDENARNMYGADAIYNQQNGQIKYQLPAITLPIKNLGNDLLDTKYDAYKSYNSKNEYVFFELHFDRLPPGINHIGIREAEQEGWLWRGIEIINPSTPPDTYYNEITIKDKIDANKDAICGIYEQVGGRGYKLGCIKDNEQYSFIYLGSSIKSGWFNVGDIKAKLRSLPAAGRYKADWFMANKEMNHECYIQFEENMMKASVIDPSSRETETMEFIKMYPVSKSANSYYSGTPGQEWSGTGFALNNGYIATNYHVVENAKEISVHGIAGNAIEKYSAQVIATDKVNDLAIIQIKDSKFHGFGRIPYRVKTSTSNVGENVFVLGYPLATTMGNEIKLTTGVISSRTGFMGDVALYQISAPIQPGNSGGPLFDNQGNLIGIVNAKHKGAENVGYAIKASYLNNLVESVTSSSILPNNNSVSSLDLTSKVKNLEKFVFMIVCSN